MAANESLTLAHRMSARRLGELLAELRDDDVLAPNGVGNLAVIRDGEYVGYVDLLPPGKVNL